MADGTRRSYVFRRTVTGQRRVAGTGVTLYQGEAPMRSPFLPLAAVIFVLACADAPTAPLVQPPIGGLQEVGKAPPPWAEISGEITTDGGVLSLSPAFSRAGSAGASFSHAAGGNTAVYVGWLLVTPGGQMAILRFAEVGTNVTFSRGAAIMKVNGKVSGRGTMTVGGHAYELSAVTEFEANGECATTAWDHDGPSCASFSAEDDSFSSEGSVWTGVLSNDPDGSAGSPGCTAVPDFLVTTGAELSSALAAAGAGSTIAIDGVIAVSAPVVIQADALRLTCATAGSGLISASGSTAAAVVQVTGDGVQVDNLFISSEPSDGVGGATHTVFAVGSLNALEGFRLTRNQIRCGHNNGTCAFLVGAPGAVVSDNTVESLGTLSGIHVQGNGPIRTDNTVVERNDIVAPTVSGSPLFGAIRVRDGSHLVVRNNASSGAWRNGIALSELNGAFIQSNSIRNAQDRGIIASTNPISQVSVRNSIIRDNRIDGPQAIGISLNRACWNRVEHNEIRVESGTLRAKFEITTGANVYVGSPARVVDQGSFDCDGNGFTDPNTISGSSGPSSSRAGAAHIEAGASRSPGLPGQSNRAQVPVLQ